MKNEKLTIYPVGVSFYEDKIKTLKVGDEVHFKHIPCEFNGVKYPNAIQIQNKNGEQVGSIAENEDPHGLQQRILRYLTKNTLTGVVASVSDISKLGYESSWTFTCEIELPVSQSDVGTWERIKTFTGEIILYNDIQHKYTDESGEIVLVGGSTYCKQFYSKFPMDKISDAVAKKYDVPQKVIQDVWGSNAKLSMLGGTTLHYAMEHYFTYRKYDFGDKEYNLPNDPYYYRAVTSFPDLQLDISPEVFVSNVERRMVGQVDALIKNKDGSYSIGDYKTGKEKTLAKEKQEEYFLQLGYYAKTLHLKSMIVKELILYYFYDGTWTVYKQDFNPSKIVI